MDQRTEGRAQVPVADILRTIAATMQQERGRINGLASFAGDGTLGTRIARAFADAADAVWSIGTGDAGDELQLAGQTLVDADAGHGGAARYLGQGLLRAGEQLSGRSGLALADLGALLTGLLAGAQEDNAAQPGDGTLLDVLSPAATAYAFAAQGGLTYQQATQGLLGAAMDGVRRTIHMPQIFNRHPTGTPRQSAGYPDPGAAAAQTCLTGLVLGLLGDRVPAPPAGESGTNFLLKLLQQGINLGGAVVEPPPASPVESLLGATRGAGPHRPASTADDRAAQAADVPERPAGAAR